MANIYAGKRNGQGWWAERINRRRNLGERRKVKREKRRRGGRQGPGWKIRHTE